MAHLTPSLLACRYTLFIVIYPAGMLSEMKLIYDALPFIRELEQLQQVGLALVGASPHAQATSSTGWPCHWPCSLAIKLRWWTSAGQLGLHVHIDLDIDACDIVRSLQGSGYRISMPNSVNFAWSYSTFLIVLLVCYPFAWFQLYAGLWRSRRSKLRQASGSQAFSHQCRAIGNARGTLLLHLLAVPQQLPLLQVRQPQHMMACPAHVSSGQQSVATRKIGRQGLSGCKVTAQASVQRQCLDSVETKLDQASNSTSHHHQQVCNSMLQHVSAPDIFEEGVTLPGTWVLYMRLLACPALVSSMKSLTFLFPMKL